jgi:transcriptional regulator with XRE-family HTH domain
MVGIGNKLRYLREKAGLSPSDLAKRLGMSRAYLWQLEHEDRKAPSSDLLYKMSKELGVSMEWFYETNEFCSRCGVDLANDVHYLTKELPYVCDPCFKEGKGLLTGHANVMDDWIEEGKTQEAK